VGLAVALAAVALVPLGSWGQTGRAQTQYVRLGGIAADARGYVYAADTDGGGVLKYTQTGAYVRTIGRPKTRFGDPPRPDQIRFPEGVAVGPDGNLYVVEAASTGTRVSVWSPTGALLRSFGDYGSGPGQMSSPKSVAVDAAGFVYVADSANSRIERFTPGGQFAASIGQGSGTITDPDKLADPTGVAVAPDGTIWASDELYRRVQHYSTGGAFLGTFGSQGSGDGQFEATAGIAAGPDSLFVADRSLSSIQAFDLGGGFAGRVGGTPGGGPGQFSHPEYLAVDCRGTLYVSDRDNNRIQRLGVPGAPTCGDPAADVSERLVLATRATRTQRFRRSFAILARASCDRPCSITVTGSVRVAGRRHALKLRRQSRVIDGTAPLDLRVAPGERDTDRLIAALRRKRAVATLRVAAVDLRGQRASRSLRVRLR
jgi:DNA-binding beta-propeller fold protein YncE